MVVNFRVIALLLGPAIIGLGLVALIPAIYALITKTPGFGYFVTVSFFAISLGYGLKSIGESSAKVKVSIRDLFIFTASLWFISTAISAFPFFMMLEDIDIEAAIFESASGLSTTGSTVIVNLDIRPPAILLWRSILQYLGGIGFVVLAVAVLPNVALGGMSIFKTESTSFDGSTKFTPHMKTMALGLIAWYFGLLIICSISYVMGGLDWFLAINTAMCTIATGGMMPIDSSMNELGPWVHYTAIFFMFLSSCPFLLAIASITSMSLAFFKDQQVRGLFIFCLTISGFVALSLIYYDGYDLEKAIRVALFNVVSVISTSGFALEDFNNWNNFATLLFFIILGIGGCSGSSSGGIKFFRLQVCFSMFKAQIRKSIHPHQVIYPSFNGQFVNSDTLRSIITYIVAYILVLFVSSLLATMLGLDLTDAFSGSLSCLSNVGPAIGQNLGPNGNFANLSGSLHLLFAFDMILGRLEILPVLLCITKTFWK